nr:hypothetical protein [Rhodococcus sp. (in: high G+C Gram-positive bacteria)]
MAMTYADFFGDPVDVIHPTVYIYAVDDEGEVPVRQLSCVLTPTEGRMEIARGRKGDQGEKGDPSPPYEDRGDIANQATLDGLVLGPNNVNWAWRNVQTNDLHVWTGSKWIIHKDAYGVQGPQGPMGQIEGVTVEMVAETEPATGTLAGTTGRSIHLKIPTKKGDKGDIGTPGAIEVAPDYKADTPAVVGDSLIKRADGKWGPGKAKLPVGPYSYGPDQFTAVSSTSDGTRLIASMTLPPLPYATYLDIEGVLRINNGLFITVGAEVRLGNGDTGVIIGRALGKSSSGDQVLDIKNWYASSFGPDNSTPIQIPANHTGTQGTVYVTLKRTSGLTSWSFSNTDAQLIVRRIPV